MEFHQLEAFVMVVTHRSFSRAADHLYLTQPTISAHVKSLETELGTSLFDRGKSELILTPAAEMLYRYAKDLLDLRSNALAEIGAYNRLSEETLTVPASSVPCQYLLPQAMAAFEKKNSGVAVILRQLNSRRVCEDIFHYHYQLGVVGEKTELPQLTFEAVLEDELVAAIPNREEYKPLLIKSEISHNDLMGYNLLLRERGSGTRSRFETELLKGDNQAGQGRIKVYDSQETIKQAVRQGLGVTVISRFVVEDYHRFGLLEIRPLLGLNLKRYIYLVYHSKRVLSPATRALLEFLQIYFKEAAS